MNKKKNKISAIVMLVCLLFQTFWPTATFALTSGPAQPEAASFEPIGTSDMVDNYSGDFTYNIPLMDIEGYPLNISYHSGITMDQEATWCGLGWNINVGAITRNMRGMPDDFDGDLVRKQINLAPNETYGVNIGVGGEIFGVDAINLNYSLGVSYNNYTGYGVTQGLGIAFTPDGFPGTLGLGLNSGPDGLTVSPHVSFSAHLDDSDEPTQGSVTVGTSINSRSGIKSVSLDLSVSQTTRGTKEKAAAAKAKTEKNKPKEKQTKGGTSQSAGTGTSVSFGTATYVPQLTMPMKNYSLSFSAKIGGTVFGVDATANIGGSYSQQALAINEDYVPAYGYLNAQDGQSQDKVLMDFNREKDGSFTENTPALPLTNFSYDIYSATGQGLGATFRPYRSDLGYVFDSRVNVTSSNLSLSGEISFGELLQAGLDVSVSEVSGTSGKWTDNNPAASSLNFTGPNTGGNPLYEPSYFKETGEKNADDDPLFSTIGGTTPVRIALENGGPFDFEVPTSSNFINENAPSLNFPIGTNYRTTIERVKRNQVLSYLTVGEYGTSALNHDSINQWIFQWNSNTSTTIKNFGNSVGGSTLSSFFTNTNYSSTSNSKHIAEMTATKTDGSRYVYGLPLYNIYQKEASFNVNNITNNHLTDPVNGFVTYNPGSDNTNGNTNGTDNFYTGTELPPYVHSYLLTDVLSADYVDVTQNGPTDDDLGNYTKFIYTTPGSTAPTYYQWRTPYGGVTSKMNQATYDPGLHTVNDDERGSYIYGIKEVRFLQKIETKNYVAVFELGNRQDGFGVSDENNSAGIGTAPLQFIKTITLYSKPDYVNNGSNAFIIKQVHFMYDYSLCTGIPNNNGHGSGYLSSNETANQGGKLTLQQIYFTYGSSFKAQLSPYQFTYNTTISTTGGGNTTPTYDIKAYDRWGNYKPNPNYGIGVKEMINAGQQPLNQDFTYVIQDTSLTNQYVRLWNLSQIKLPSGGTINVNYESDDYAYVQNQPATQMMIVNSAQNGPPVSHSSSIPISNVLSANNSYGGQYYYFKLQTPISGSNTQTQANSIVNSSYIKGMTQLYFRFYTNVNNSQGTSPFFAKGYEYVSGYADIASAGAHFNTTTNLYDYGYVQLAPTTGGDHLAGLCCGDMENPISKGAWHFARIHTPMQAYNGAGTGVSSSNQVSFIQALCNSSIIGGIINFFKGANGQLKSLGYGSQFDPSRSWIRLYNPTGHKLGGGSRVTSVTITDQWNNMVTSGPGSFTYGQIYNYTTTDPATGNTISSGVATYEPSFGADENVMRQPLYFLSKKADALLAPDNNNYMETPLGESFFPSPTVGYSKVTVQNLPRYNSSPPNLLVKSNATGYVVYEFYTPLDFPVILNQTNLAAFRKKSNPLASLFHLEVKDWMTASEGFSIELNDMAGKPKAQTVYAQGQTVPISGTRHYYKQSGNQLVNTCTTVDKFGTVKNSQVGLDFDFIADFREQLNTTNSFSLGGNMHLEITPPAVEVEITVIPTSSEQSNRFRSASVTKVFNHYGIEDSTVVFDLSSRVATKNLAWDAETGDVLLTQTTTEFNDNTYSFNYPAKWGYPLMGGAYANTGVVVSNAIDVNGTVNSTATPYLVPGDEVEILTSTPSKGWVYNNFGTLIVIDKTGLPITGNSGATLKVIRSGLRNMQDLSMGKLVSFNNPVWTGASPPTGLGALPTLDTSFHILSASSTVYNNKWNIFCECGIAPGTQGNAYLLGLMGNWREQVAYTYLTLRSQSNLNQNTNIRKDGTFLTFSPFWTPNSGAAWNKNTTNWQFTSQVTQYSPHGFEIENVDPLLRYSSALYGYNYALPIGVSSNAKYQETAFDGFEDYDFNSCTDDHFGWKAVVLNNVKVCPTSPATPANYNCQPFPFNTYQTFSHTGRRSVVVNPGQNKTITKVLNACSSAPTVVPGTISGH